MRGFYFYVRHETISKGRHLAWSLMIVFKQHEDKDEAMQTDVQMPS